MSIQLRMRVYDMSVVDLKVLLSLYLLFLKRERVFFKLFRCIKISQQLERKK